MASVGLLFGDEPWKRRDESRELSEGSLLPHFLLRLHTRTAVMVPWRSLGELREVTVAGPHSRALFPQSTQQSNRPSLQCQNKLALFPTAQEASSEVVFAKP